MPGRIYRDRRRRQIRERPADLGGGDGEVSTRSARPQAHPYLICTRCGKIEDVALDGISALAAESAAIGYGIRSHPVDFYGLCAGCR